MIFHRPVLAFALYTFACWMFFHVVPNTSHLNAHWWWGLAACLVVAGFTYAMVNVLGALDWEAQARRDREREERWMHERDLRDARSRYGALKAREHESGGQRIRPQIQQIKD